MKIGLIAGNGQFPLFFSKVAKNKGFYVYAAAYRKETDPALARLVEAVEWIHLGQVNRLIRFFKKHGVREAVMLGGITKTRMFSDVRPDFKALSLVAKARHTHDDGMLRAFAELLDQEGITIRASTFLLPELLAPAGCWTRKRPSGDQMRDIELGWRLAKEIGRLDIGQCVVVGGGSVLAVEAIDGTDATIRRGGRLGKGNAVLVKVLKPDQDERFDLPAIGAQTVRNMAAAGIRALALEAGRAVVFDREEMISRADRSGIAILALSDEDMRRSG
jgi:DUF1009 family protein